MFETGAINLKPDSFHNIMAMSSGDASFVAVTLLCNPYEHPETTELKIIVGTVGRARILLLINPKQLSKEKQAWQKYRIDTYRYFPHILIII
jgi:hypothetical protein